MLTTTRRRRVLEAFLVRLRTIRESRGFETDAGLQVFTNETPAFGEDDPNVAIAIIVGDEALSWQLPGKACQVTLPLEIQALARAGLEDSWLVVEAVLGDIKRAIEVEDRTLGGVSDFPIERGPARTLQRESGSVDVGAALTYTPRFKEGWGTP